MRFLRSVKTEALHGSRQHTLWRSQLARTLLHFCCAFHRGFAWIRATHTLALMHSQLVRTLLHFCCVHSTATTIALIHASCGCDPMCDVACSSKAVHTQHRPPPSWSNCVCVTIMLRLHYAHCILASNTRTYTSHTHSQTSLHTHAHTHTLTHTHTRTHTHTSRTHTHTHARAHITHT